MLLKESGTRTLDGLRSEHAEGMRYRNAVGLEIFNRQAMEQAREEKRVHARPALKPQETYLS